MNVELGRIIRYGITGALTACVYLGLASVGVEIFQMSPVAASVGSQITTIAVAYYGHALFSFQVRPDRLSLARFVSIAITSILLNVAVVWLLDVWLKVPYAVAIAAVAILVPLYSYLCNRFWVFLPGLDASPIEGKPGFAGPAKSPKTDGVK